MKRPLLFSIIAVLAFAGCSMDTDPPPAVTDVSAVISDASRAEITVTWTDPTAEDLDHIWVGIGDRGYDVDPGKGKHVSHWHDFDTVDVRVSAVDESGNASQSVSETLTVNSQIPSSPLVATIEETEGGSWKPAGSESIVGNGVEWWEFDLSGYAGYDTLKVQATRDGYSPSNTTFEFTADVDLIAYSEEGEFLARASDPYMSVLELADGEDYDSGDSANDTVYVAVVEQDGNSGSYAYYAWVE